MKKTLPLLVLISALVGCQLEKRHYRSGYYISHREAGVSRVQKLEDHPEEAPSVVSFGSPADLGFNDSNAVCTVAPDKVLTLVESPVIASAGIPKIQEKSKGEASKPMERKRTSGESGNSHLIVTLGWVCMVLAVISLFIFWPLIFFILPGIILLIVGYSKGGGPKVQKEDQLQDVVYLKNGSIVRGVIIEQVPGVSLKIKTKDGSVFFYKMEEIEKMTKE